MVEAMDIERGFKQTEIGVIPSDWEVIRIGEVFKFKNGLNKEKSFFGEGTPIVNYMDVYKNSGIRAKDLIGKVTLSNQEIKNYEVKKGDVFFTRTSETVEEIGIASVVLEELKNTVFSGFILRASPFNSTVEIEFCRFCFSSKEARKQIVSTASYTTRALTNGRLLSDVKIPLPPTKAEQTAIAIALNDADALITRLEKLIAKKRNIKQGAMQELLKPKEGWKVKKLGEVAEINMGQSPDSINYNLSGEGKPLIQGNADIENRKSIKRVWTKQITKTCEQHDLIMTVRAPVGAIGIASENSCIGRGICSFKITGVDKYFLYHLLIFKETDWKILEQGSTFTSANSNQIFGFELSIPKDEPEQIRITQILSDMDAEIEALEKKLEKYKMIKQGMMQNLLTGKIRLV